MVAISARLGLVALLCITPDIAASAKPRPKQTTSHIDVVSRSVSATFCENSACEPVSLRIPTGDSFIMYRWGDHREPVRIANIDAPLINAKCIREQASAQLAIDRLAQYLYQATFTMARLYTDRSGTIAFVSANRWDLGHMLSRDRVVWPWEPRHRSWC
ncbi:nuclease [Rhizobium sp. ZPR3]|uniref:Nuclease n=2 Tax=unclassified Rhizobium TaxID=2613769 RepID=A0AAU7SRR5_9HYPH